MTLMPGRAADVARGIGVIDAKALPPGRYVARASITRDGKRGWRARAAVRFRAGAAGARAGSGAVAAARVAFASSLPSSIPRRCSAGGCSADAGHGGAAVAR